jgi:hypothetical protein
MPWLRYRHLKPEFLTVHDAVDRPGVKSCEVVEERPRGADIAAARLGTEAGCMRAHALVVVKLMVADIALAAFMRALDLCRHDDGVHHHVVDVKGTTMLALLALDARELGDAGAATQVSTLALHKSKLVRRHF